MSEERRDQVEQGQDRKRDRASAFSFQPEHDGTLSIKSAVYQAIGRASVLFPDVRGVFDDRSAVEVAEALLAEVERLADATNRPVDEVGRDVHEAVEAFTDDAGAEEKVDRRVPGSTVLHAGKDKSLRPEANLGLATTGQLLDEIRTRIEVHGPGLQYRTVDG